MQHRLLGTMPLVLVLPRVLRMTFGCKHTRALCAHRAKRFSSRFPHGFTSRPLATAMAEGGGRYPFATLATLQPHSRVLVDIRFGLASPDDHHFVIVTPGRTILASTPAARHPYPLAGFVFWCNVTHAASC